MGKLVYRMCLVVILMIAVAGGVYYYRTFYQAQDSQNKGTFVKRAEDAVQRADEEIFEPAPEVLQETA